MDTQAVRHLIERWRNGEGATCEPEFETLRLCANELEDILDNKEI